MEIFDSILLWLVLATPLLSLGFLGSGKYINMQTNKKIISRYIYPLIETYSGKKQAFLTYSIFFLYKLLIIVTISALLFKGSAIYILLLIPIAFFYPLIYAQDIFRINRYKSIVFFENKSVTAYLNLKNTNEQIEKYSIIIPVDRKYYIKKVKNNFVKISDSPNIFHFTGYLGRKSNLDNKEKFWIRKTSKFTTLDEFIKGKSKENAINEMLNHLIYYNIISLYTYQDFTYNIYKNKIVNVKPDLNTSYIKNSIKGNNDNLLEKAEQHKYPVVLALNKINRKRFHLNDCSKMLINSIYSKGKISMDFSEVPQLNLLFVLADSWAWNTLETSTKDQIYQAIALYNKNTIKKHDIIIISAQSGKILKESKSSTRQSS